MKNKYKVKFIGFDFLNRWKRRKFSRPGSWVYIGVGKWYFSHAEFKYYLSFFGLELSIWFVRMVRLENER